MTGSEITEPDERMVLRHVDGSFAIHRFAPDTPIPPAVLESDLFSVTRTAHELSVVCRSGLIGTRAAPSGQDLLTAAPSAVDSPQHTEPDWSCLEVLGPLPFTLTGVLARLAAALAGEGVSVFAISTYDTDYLFVKTDALRSAKDALTRAGCMIPVT